MDEKNIGLYDNELIIDDGHDTPKELEIKHSKSLYQWRNEARKLKAERDRQAKAGEEKPPMLKAKDEEVLTRGE